MALQNKDSIWGLGFGPMDVRCMMSSLAPKQPMMQPKFPGVQKYKLYVIHPTKLATQITDKC
jgi:hypothetical protein